MRTFLCAYFCKTCGHEFTLAPEQLRDAWARLERTDVDIPTFCALFEDEALARRALRGDPRRWQMGVDRRAVPAAGGLRQGSRSHVRPLSGEVQQPGEVVEPESGP